MRWLRRLRHWLQLRRHHAELMDELTFHRDMIERDLIARGMSPADARSQARRTMGNETLMREDARSVWVWPSLESMWQDAVYTLRDLRRHPTFTLGVMLTLGLGLGANTAMFSLVDHLLFRAPSRMIDAQSVSLVYLYRRSANGKESTTGGIYARYADIARWSTSLSSTATFSLKSLAIGIGTDTRLRNVAVVSANFFTLFDAPPVVGRYFTSREDAPSNPAPVAVISYGAWKTQFGGRDDVLGSTVHIDAVAYTIVGIAPEDFVGLWPYRPPAAFVPVTTYAASEGPSDWATTYGHAIGLGIIGRRHANVTEAEASADITNALRRSYLAQNPDAARLTRLRPRAVAASVLTNRGPEPSNIASAATWLSGVTVVVLLIACANVANLLLARTIRRRREIAVRVALGVSRSRLFGQLLSEGIVLALLGSVVGVLIAVWGSRVLSATFLPGTEPAPLLSDLRTLLFASVLTLGVGVLIGLAPMLQVRRGNLTADLKSAARDGAQPPKALRTGLLLLQSALSVVLLVGAGLFVQSLQNVRSVHLGFDADSVLLVGLNMRDSPLDSAATVALRLRLLESVKEVPGVTHVTLQESVPFAGSSSRAIFVAGIDSTRKLGVFNFNTVSPDYFATMGTRILRGRAIAPSDVDGAQRIAVIGQAMGNALWPGQEPIGRCFRIDADSMPCTYVVGVAEDIHSETITDESGLFFYYMPAAQWRPDDGGLFVRGRGDASRLVEPVRRRLQQDMPGTSFVTVKPLSDLVDATMRSWIVGARVFTAFGVLALVLAAVGLYSVIAYDVTQRRHEIGVRLALGAARSSIVGLVVSASVRIAIAGIVIGGGVATLGAKWIAPLLFRQSPHDPLVFAFVGLLLVAVAVAASSIPAARAARVDPKAALQSD